MNRSQTEQPEQNYDVVIVGAGAAGLLAAAVAAKRGRRVVLLEKNRKAGVKILMSGGTRCNLTQATDAAGIATAFGSQGRFLRSSLSDFGPEDLVRLFDGLGVPTKVESTGKIFPKSDRALDVQRALVHYATDCGADLVLGQAVQSVAGCEANEPARFVVQTEATRFLCESLLITTGGQSYPGCGTTGDGYVWAKQFGHKIEPPTAALVPLRSTASWATRLSGVTIPDVGLRLRCETDTKLNKRLKKQGYRNSFLFTHHGVSGPGVLDISRLVTRNAGNDFTLLCDFVPSQSEDSLRAELRLTAERQGKSRVANALIQWLPKRLVEALLEEATIPADRVFSEFSRAELGRLLAWLKSAEVPVHGTLGFKKAEVTAGGVSLREVSSQTMQSKLRDGLFFAGEVLDLDGPIGGYNFQAAFSTGRLAALHV